VGKLSLVSQEVVQEGAEKGWSKVAEEQVEVSPSGEAWKGPQLGWLRWLQIQAAAQAAEVHAQTADISSVPW
jgi:hypothetical protein